MTQTTDPRTGTATPDLSTLRDAVRGRVLLPGDDGFEDASRPWNVAVPQRPAAVVHVADEQDVVAVVRLAREQGFVVSAQPGGHGATDALDGTVLVRTDALNEVVVDRAAGIARVGAGVKWGQLLAALDGIRPDRDGRQQPGCVRRRVPARWRAVMVRADATGSAPGACGRHTSSAVTAPSGGSTTHPTPT